MIEHDHDAIVAGVHEVMIEDRDITPMTANARNVKTTNKAVDLAIGIITG